tara:strand:+ start:617 stop:748 length:132 start_codon:yes stop_codon:yes gene_type:complete
MPVNLRKFYLHQLQSIKKQENDEAKKHQKKSSARPPAFTPRKR